MSDLHPVFAYTDGGLLGSNPSSYGGTYAWCLVNQQGQMTIDHVMWITPGELGLPTITNNHTELLAVIDVLEVLPFGWRGTLYSDSQVTLQRFGNPRAALNNVPPPLIRRLRVVQQKHPHLKTVLLQGHPTSEELRAGIGRSGRAVSKFNAWCDYLCTKEAERHLSC